MNSNGASENKSVYSPQLQTRSHLPQQTNQTGVVVNKHPHGFAANLGKQM